MDFKTDILPLKNPLYRLALRITLNREEAEDIVQDTLMRVWGRRDSWDSIENVSAWAMTVCRNLALDSMKKKERENVSIDDSLMNSASAEASPLEMLSRKESMQRVHDIINALPEKQRSCVHMRDLEGMTYKEISAVMGISEEQVKVSIFRARKSIREKII